jgi:hypothetical protein
MERTSYVVKQWFVAGKNSQQYSNGIFQHLPGSPATIPGEWRKKAPHSDFKKVEA